MTKTVLLLATACLASVWAADPPAPKFWSNSEFQQLEKTLPSKMDETKSGAQPMAAFPSHSALFFHREGSGLVEIHQKLADYVVVRSGEGAVMVGGRLADPKPGGPNELRGTILEGATRFPVAAGDVLYIPANTPHRMVVESGHQLNAMVIKVEEE